MRAKCPFTFRGRPTTKPNTPEDAKRIKLSQWITALLVRHGDEQPGVYTTPGATGYSAEELASAEVRYAHLGSEKPVVPEPEMQLQALGFLRAGLSPKDIAEELEVPLTKFKDWRQSESFSAEWEAAKAEGQGHKPRSSARHDAATAQRVPSEPPPIIIPSPMAPSNTDSVLQALALEKLAGGMSSADVIKEVRGLSGLKLAAWRKDEAFKARWEEAKKAGNNIRNQAHIAKAPTAEPLPRRSVHQQAFADERSEAPAASAPEPKAELVVMSAVHGPAHYNGTEVFDQMMLLFGKDAVASFCRLNAYKYRMRAGKKPGNSIEQDVSKALWYEERLKEIA